MHKGIFKLGSILAAVTVLLGAFAAHGLRSRLSEYGFSVFETGVKYQFYHTIAIMIAALAYREANPKLVLNAARLFLVGIIVFSGSLYLLALNEGLKWLGAITPFGGVSFIAGWVMLFLSVMRTRS